MTTATERRQRYLDQLVLSLRVRGVPGERLRDLVDEAHAHLEESGEDPEVAFGPPHAYAAELAGEPGPRIRRGRSGVRGLLPGLLLAAGLVLLIETVVPAVTGTEVELRVGNVVALALIAVGVWVALPLLDAQADGRLGWAAPLAAITAIWVGAATSTVVLATPLLTVPVGAAGSVGLALAVAGGVATWRTVDLLPPSRFDATGGDDPMPPR
jgi:hypothetical protein